MVNTEGTMSKVDGERRKKSDVNFDLLNDKSKYRITIPVDR